MLKYTCMDAAEEYVGQYLAEKYNEVPQYEPNGRGTFPDYSVNGDLYEVTQMLCGPKGEEGWLGAIIGQLQNRLKENNLLNYIQIRWGEADASSEKQGSFDDAITIGKAAIASNQTLQYSCIVKKGNCALSFLFSRKAIASPAFACFGGLPARWDYEEQDDILGVIKGKCDKSNGRPFHLIIAVQRIPVHVIRDEYKRKIAESLCGTTCKSVLFLAKISNEDRSI